MKRLIVLLLFLPFTSWSQNSEDLPYVQRETFVSNTFGFPISIQNFKKNYSGILRTSKKPIINIQDNSVSDTIYTFSAGTTKIEIYKAQDRDILQSAYITTDKIPIKYNIKIGESKASIAKKLKTRILKDKIQVGDLEQQQVYTFTFSKGKLLSIAYEGYIE